MNKYEYKTLIYETECWYSASVDATHFDKRLNKLAEERWELDKCFPVTESYGRTKSIVLIFKREIQ